MRRASRHFRRPGVIAAALAAILCVAGRHADAQPIASNLQLANPSALEFRVDGDLENATEYHVELIRASEAPAAAQPVKVWDGRANRAADGIVRIDLTALVAGVDDGEYVATLTVAGTVAAMTRSAVVGPFTLFGHGSASNEAAAQSGGAAPAGDRGRERMWTRIAIAVAAGLMVIPFIVR